MDSKYTTELVDASGNLLADLVGRAKGRSITRSRNEADEITWSIDLNEFERYCRLLNVDPKTLIIPNSTEVRIRRGQNYLAGGQINYIETSLSPTQQTVSVRAVGFLNLFKSRFSDDIYTATEATTIAQNLIMVSQGSSTVTLTNLVTNPSFETGLSAGLPPGWAVEGSISLLTISTGYSGSNSVTVTSLTSGGAISHALTPTPGTYTASVYFRGSGTNSGTITLRNLTSNTVIGATTVTPLSGTWTRATVTAPVTSQIGIELSSNVGGSIDCDAVQLESGSTANTYFDGSLTSTSSDTYAWTGTANASSSTDVKSISPSGVTDFGIRPGPIQATVGTHDRSYERTNIKEALQNLTDVQVHPFDFDFTYNKLFNTYAQLGSQRPDIIFEYPGNIKSARIPLDATEMANSVIVLGSGFGTDASAIATVNDAGSQANYKLRQKVILESSTELTATLQEQGNIELAKSSTPNEVPQIEIDGNMAPYITDFGIGDYVLVRITGHRWLDHINTFYRVEKYTLTIDEDDNETISLSLSR